MYLPHRDVSPKEFVSHPSQTVPESFVDDMRFFSLGASGKRWIRRVPAIPLAWAVALIVKMGLVVQDRSPLDLARRLADGGAWLQGTVSPSDVVAIVHRLVPGTSGSGQCLFRALVRFGVLRRIGVDTAAFCLGVQSPTTARRFAHAWVEVENTPIGEPNDPRRTHHLLVRCDSTDPLPPSSSNSHSFSLKEARERRP